MIEQDTVTIRSSDGSQVPLYWHPAARPRCVVLLLPALGIQAKLYRTLAGELADQGCSVALLEQRGHGLSNVRASYSQRYSLIDTLEQDMPAALQWLGAQHSDVPLLLGGHSLGGHLSTIYAGQHPTAIAGIVHLACGFPYYRDFAPKEQRLLRFLCAIMPIFSLLPGYYPGELVGFGGRESMAMMKQWRQWAMSGCFDIDQHSGMAEAVAQFTGPVLSVSFERDNFSTTAAVDRAVSPFCNASLRRVTLGSEEQGDYLGHTAWARQPTGVSKAISQWLKENWPSEA